MELKGFDSAQIAVLNDDEKVITGENGLSETGIFEVNANTSKGTISAALSGLAPTFTNISGSDQTVDVAGKGVGQLQCVFAANDMPAKILNRITGLKRDEKTGAWYADKETRPPMTVLNLVTHDSKDKKAYIGLLKGMFVPGDRTLNTNTDAGEQRATDSITFRSIGRDSDGRAYTEGFEGDTEFKIDEYMKDLFPGTKTVTP